MNQPDSSRFSESRWKRWLLLGPLVAVLALSACRGETEPVLTSDLSVVTHPDGSQNFEQKLRSKVTLDEGEQGRAWFEACDAFGYWDACSGSFYRVTNPVAFGPMPDQGGSWGPIDFNRRVVGKAPPPPPRCQNCFPPLVPYRLCGDLTVNGQRTGKVCWDQDGKAEGNAATGGRHYDFMYGIPDPVQ